MTAFDSPPPFVPQLLAVYNRRFHPLTIRTHVEHLRKRGFVWWGRFRADAGRLSTDEARAEWSKLSFDGEVYSCLSFSRPNLDAGDQPAPMLRLIVGSR